MSWATTFLPAVSGAILGASLALQGRKDFALRKDLPGMVGVYAGIPFTGLILTSVAWFMAIQQNATSALATRFTILGMVAGLTGIAMGATGLLAQRRMQSLEESGRWLVKMTLWEVPLIFALMYVFLGLDL